MGRAWIRTVGFVVAVMLGLVGCSGDDQADNAPSTTAAESESSTSTEPTTTTAGEDPAVLRAYVADMAPPIDSWHETFDPLPSCAAGACDPADGINILGLSFITETISLTSQTAERDNPPAPDDVAELLEGLRSAAAEVKTAHDAWQAGSCAIPATAVCQPLLVELEREFGSMDDAVVQWESIS